MQNLFHLNEIFYNVLLLLKKIKYNNYHENITNTNKLMKMEK